MQRETDSGSPNPQQVGGDPSRRDFIQKALYIPPAILTLAAAPAYAKNGSAKSMHKSKHKTKHNGNGKHRGKEH